MILLDFDSTFGEVAVQSTAALIVVCSIPVWKNLYAIHYFYCVLDVVWGNVLKKENPLISRKLSIKIVYQMLQTHNILI